MKVKKSGLIVLFLLLGIMLAGLIICLSLASRKSPNPVKLVDLKPSLSIGIM
jgi:hypothetical protein